MKPLCSLLATLILGACAGPPQTLVVKQYQLRDQVRKADEEPLLRMEKSRRLHGAVSMEERRQRLGQYFTVIWNDAAGAGHGNVMVDFHYQQGATASLVKHLNREFSTTTTQGSAEFAVIGDDYFKGGRVLCWKATVSRGGKLLASRQSYLWQ